MVFSGGSKWGGGGGGLASPNLLGEPKENISAETYLKEAMNKEWS